MPAFPREELEERMERWLQANRNAERERDGARGLIALFGWVE